MQKNLYYRTVLRRENALQNFFLSLLSTLSSHPRLLLEVFIRKGFGERYFRLISGFSVFLILGIFPLFAETLSALGDHLKQIVTAYGGMPGSTPEAPPQEPSFLFRYLTWYIFLVLFLLKSIQHHLAMKRLPSIFDFQRYSLCGGTINPIFEKIKLGGKPADVRTIETLLEPGFFFIIGIVLWLFGQNLGILLVVSSIFYSASYFNAYISGDNFIMDKIDEMICNQELANVFLNDDDGEAMGFRPRFRKPENRDIREKILPMMTEEVTEAK